MREKLLEVVQMECYPDSLILTAWQATLVIRASITMHRCYPEQYEAAMKMEDLERRNRELATLQIAVLQERERVFEACYLQADQYPKGFIYLCNWDESRKVYKNMGYRYGINGHEYMSGFGTVNMAGWLHPNSI